MTIRSLQKVNLHSPDYQSLLKQVKKTLLEGQARIEQERVRTYWETGRLINTHILKNKDRAQYGGEVIARLCKDLSIEISLLQRCVQFAKAYPDFKNSAGRRNFTWTHYRKLIVVPDPVVRGRMEERAARHQWSADELAARIKEGKVKPPAVAEETPPAQKFLTPARGELYTYQITKRPAVAAAAEPELLIDLGFSNFHKVDEKLISRFSAGQIIESRGANDEYKFYAGSRTPKDLYTYQAYVERVIDGDTLKVRVDQGFNMWTRQVLRLRDIDCPEVGTREGEAAKNFVRSLLKEASLIVLRSSKSDKYDRYLADIFIPQGEEPDAATDAYLNNLLLEKGYARRA